ncbi:hypothetical protein LXL04_016082 [Taraxacum kok-saghyz]
MTFLLPTPEDTTFGLKKKRRMNVFGMFRDFSIDYELAQACIYEYTLKPSPNKKDVTDLKSGVLYGKGVLYEDIGKLKCWIVLLIKTR